MECHLKKTPRDANIEFLRLLSMLMIMTMHCMAWSGALYEQVGFNYYFYWWVEALCVSSVDIFVLISGYYLAESRFRAERMLRTLITVWSYAFLCSLISARLSGAALSFRSVLMMLCPILTKKYWFVNAYLAMYLFSPFLNRLIHSLSRKQFAWMLGCMILLFVVRPTLLPASWSQDLSGGMSVTFFLVLYCTGAWFRLHQRIRSGKTMLFLGLYMLLSLALVGSKWLILRAGLTEATAVRFYSYDSIPVVMQACLLFCAFRGKREMCQKPASAVCRLATTAFAAYIIHYTMTTVLWSRIIPVSHFVWDLKTGIPAIFLSVILVYLICFVIESARQKIFPLDKIEQKLSPLFQKWNAVTGELAKQAEMR